MISFEALLEAIERLNAETRRCMVGIAFTPDACWWEAFQAVTQHQACICAEPGEGRSVCGVPCPVHPKGFA